VEIGIPNKNLEDVRGLTENIDDIYRSGDYIDVYFDEEYEEGDVVDFAFSFRQHCMFDHASGQLTYVFTPGWFDEIQVGKCTILWAADGVQSGDYGDVITDDEGQAYYVWTASLDYGQQLTATIEYNDSAFDWQQEMDYIQQKQQAARRQVVTVLLVLLSVVILIILLYELFGGKYCYTRRSGVYYYHLTKKGNLAPGPDSEVKKKIDRQIKKKENTDSRTVGGHSISNRVVSGHYIAQREAAGHAVASRNSGGHSSGGGSSCACACACACAGGGRAGCSRKDFYGTKLTTMKIREALQERQHWELGKDHAKL
jgi:hypothetical protein